MTSFQPDVPLPTVTIHPAVNGYVVFVGPPRQTSRQIVGLVQRAVMNIPGIGRALRQAFNVATPDDKAEAAEQQFDEEGVAPDPDNPEARVGELGDRLTGVLAPIEQITNKESQMFVFNNQQELGAFLWQLFVGPANLPPQVHPETVLPPMPTFPGQGGEGDAEDSGEETADNEGEDEGYDDSGH